MAGETTDGECVYTGRWRKWSKISRTWCCP